jgi:hypothetical protein
MRRDQSVRRLNASPRPRRKRELTSSHFAGLGLAVAVVLAIALLAAQKSVVDLEYYRVVGQRVIVVGVAVAPCSWTRVTNVAETPAAVRVTIETLPCPILGPGTPALDGRELDVALTTDLGTRTGEDGTGRDVPER